MDMNLLLCYLSASTRTCHHTAPTNALFALHESLLLIRLEGLENAWTRHSRHHVALKAGLEAMGLKFLVKEQYQLPQMNAVLCPGGVDEEQVRRTLLAEFGLDIGAGLGPLKGKIWRFGYEQGDLLGEVFPDVPPALARWRNQGRKVIIFSSGSVQAQKLLFAHTTLGDLSHLIDGYFDTRIGAKTDPSSYQKIADQIGIHTGSILFVSDVTAELVAARSAGLRTALSVRPGNHPQPESAVDAVVESFDDVPLNLG